ncbi:oligosaccharide flippase family protein [Flavobacterium sp. ZB4P13]|uniref:oligosaccharide flippase family protein n=1 Tax=Flavobacterium sp. ZB4P13 TaxID=3401728 RepID=UPI003AAE4385
MIKKFFLHSFIYALGPQIPKLIVLVTLPIVTPFLSSFDFGVYGLIISYIGSVQLIKDLGLNLLFYNSFYKKTKTYTLIWRNLIGILFVWSFFYSLIIGSITYFLINRWDSKHSILVAFLFFIPALFFENINSIGIAFFRTLEKPLPIAINAIISGTVSAIVSFIFIVYFKSGYIGWVLGIAIASFISCLHYSYVLFLKEKLIPLFRFKKKSLRYYLGIGLPMIPHNYSSYLLNTSDRLVMDVLKVDINEIGKYNVAYMFGSYFSMLENVISFSSSTYYIRYFVENEYLKVRTLTFFLQVLFLNATFIVCLWLNEILFLMIKNVEYSNISTIGILIIMGYNYKPMYMASNMQLSIEGKTKKLLKISFVGGVINVILNFIFIPFFGIIAAAISTFIALMYIGFMGFYLNDFNLELKKLVNPKIWLSLIVLMTILLLISNHLPIYYKILFMGLLIFINLMLYKNQKVNIQNLN